jgi:hypothetical protein
MFKRRPKNTQAALMGAELSPSRTHALIWRTANSLLGDEGLLQTPARIHAAEYLGWLINKAHERDVEAARLTEIAEGAHDSSVSVGKLLYEGGHSMRVRYGDPQLYGMETPMAPVSLEDAVYASDAVNTVRSHMADVYMTDFWGK